MSWRVIEHITIYKETGLYSAHPSLVRAPDGDLLTFFHRSPDHQYSRHSHPLFDVRMCRSSDGGQTWSSPRFVTSDPLGGILDFLGLDVAADLGGYREKAAVRGITTPSYLAVQNPINRSAIGRWQAYQGELAPALERLAPFVAAFGYQ